MRRFARIRLSFVVIAPAIVVLLGLCTALAIGALGVRDLVAQSDNAAALRAQLLVETLVERLRATPEEDRRVFLERATRRSGTDMLLVRQDGAIVVDAALSAPSRSQIESLLIAGAGQTATKLGRTRYYAHPLPQPLTHLSLIAFVPAPETPVTTRSLITSLATLTAILVGVSALVGFTFARDVRADVTYMRARIAEMAREGAAPSGKVIPVRAIDEVGLLTNAFNIVVDRFEAAERAYGQDLDGALAYDKDRSAFVAALSHELRTPLNAILGFTDILLSEVDGPLSLDATENLAQVRSSGEHLAALIDDILDLSALESGELRLSRQDSDVYTIAAEVVKELQAAAAKKGLALVLLGSTATARVDPRRVRQILTNIVGNAVKFTSGGHVVVSVEPRDAYVGLLVTDTGPGIPRSEQESIFEEYRQSGEVSTQRVGTGLGLAITRRLVQMHGGSIGLQSELGVGSSFAVLLPRLPPDAKDMPPEIPPILTASSRHRLPGF
ncbi:MAG: HAMP domain-containing sensor histidine kinase [Polyangiaceae bacterium]|nr:HAMP domain-containing sensor histidine kinase [Polyangiaceae bacterium]